MKNLNSTFLLPTWTAPSDGFFMHVCILRKMIMLMNRFTLPLIFVIIFFNACDQARDSKTKIPHLLRQDSVTRLIVDGKPFIMLAGELHNSSASSLDYMAPQWQKLVDMNLNTVITPVYWELLEPEEGKFDFKLVDGLIEGAREHGLKLVLLWFASWKNTESSYAPQWVKKDTQRFFRAQTAEGAPREIVSPFCREAQQADTHAFAQLMRHLRITDAVEHTVIMVQIENETGLLGDPRDFCPEAEKAFSENVPDELPEYLQKNTEQLHPELAATWQRQGGKTSGTWTEVFGADAPEIFMAWHIAGYVNVVAKAGKAEYPLPMYANAWLRAKGQAAGQYPSGGPIDKVHDIWRAAAPSLDLLAPDIYLPYFKEICASNSRNGNPLMIPEALRNAGAVGQAMYALAQHNALCFAPFGIDGVADIRPIQAGYGFLKNLLPVFSQYRSGKEMIGILQETESEEWFTLGGCRLQIRYAGDPQGGQKSYGFIINSAPDEFLIAGSGYEVRFHPLEGGRRPQILQDDEVFYQDGRWVTRRRLNGDETGANQRIALPKVVFAEQAPRLAESATNPPIPKPPVEFVVQRVKLYRP
jgi:hypothetical protein